MESNLNDKIEIYEMGPVLQDSPRLDNKMINPS